MTLKDRTPDQRKHDIDQLKKLSLRELHRRIDSAQTQQTQAQARLALTIDWGEYKRLLDGLGNLNEMIGDYQEAALSKIAS
jgi:hypothetical protein